MTLAKIAISLTLLSKNTILLFINSKNSIQQISIEIIDISFFIYFIEKNENNPQYYDKVKNFFMNGYETDKEFVTSVITMEEYYVFPYRNKNDLLI